MRAIRTEVVSRLNVCIVDTRALLVTHATIRRFHWDLSGFCPECLIECLLNAVLIFVQ